MKFSIHAKLGAWCAPLAKETKDTLHLAFRQIHEVARFYRRLAVVALKVAAAAMIFYAVGLVLTSTPEQIRAFWTDPAPALANFACELNLAFRRVVLHVVQLLQDVFTLQKIR